MSRVPIAANKKAGGGHAAFAQLAKHRTPCEICAAITQEFVLLMCKPSIMGAEASIHNTIHPIQTQSRHRTFTGRSSCRVFYMEQCVALCLHTQLALALCDLLFCCYGNKHIVSFFFTHLLHTS